MFLPKRAISLTNMRQTFEAKLIGKGPGNAWTYLAIPFDVQQVFGTKARVLVAGTLNGFPFRNSLMPEGDGTHSLMVSKELQQGANAKAGDVVSISLELDLAERAVTLPEELASAFKANRQAASFFERLTHSQKKEYIDWVRSAKQASTKAGRVAKSLEMLTAGKKRLR